MPVTADVPVAGMQIERALRRDLHLDANAAMHVEVKAPLVRRMYLQIDFVRILTFRNTDTAAADGDSRRSAHATAIVLLTPRVTSMEASLVSTWRAGIVADLVGLGPFVSKSGEA